MAEAKQWNGVEFTLSPRSHREYECWVNPGEIWKAETYDGGRIWYARLRIGVHRFSGQGTDMMRALDDARDTAFKVATALSSALDQT